MTAVLMATEIWTV